MQRKSLASVTLALWATFNIELPVLHAQGTAFTYQGRLNDGANPENGFYDLQFGMFHAPNTGTQQGNWLTNSATVVSNGLFTVTLDFGNQFPGASRWLEMAVRTSGGGSFFTLSPRQAITSAPYAIAAGSVTGPINGGLIAAGTITGGQLGSGAAAANLQASGQSGVPSGGIILSPSNSAALLNAGYVKIGNMQESDVWQSHDTGPPPAARSAHSAVWTGGEMIICDATVNGGRYNPISNGWSPTSAAGGVPTARFDHTAAWTGTEMIIWGGYDKINGILLNDGARYNPVSDSWTATSPSGPPVARERHTAIWTGSEMIIWGGLALSSSIVGYPNETSSYTPRRNMFLYQRQ